MGTGVLAVAFCSQLVALVTCSANSPPDRACCSCCSRGGSIRVLSVLLLRPCPGEMWIVNSYVLLKLLESVMRWRHTVESTAVEMTGRHVAIG
jgi:hypothetical protein